MKSNEIIKPVFPKLLFVGFFSFCSGQALAQSTESGSAGTFFQHFFIAGGPIVWFVLLPMSVITVYLAIDLLVTIRRSRLLPSGLSSEICAVSMRQGVNAILARFSGQSDLISYSVLHTIEQQRQPGGTVESARQYAAEALQERGLRLMRKAQWCQIIGSVAPMVGLFGTVFGMIQAFNLLGQGTEGPRYELLAEAISIALVTTFWGLLVGIPSLFFYGMFQTRIEAFVSEAAIEVDSLLGRIYESGSIKQGRPQAAALKQSSSGALK
jgi:biopolymer transport protein ExbB